MYVTRVPNRGSPPAVLLRESYREDGKVRTRTLANLSRWPEHKVEKLQRALKGLSAAPDLAAARAAMRRAVVIGIDRSFTQDPRFGLIALSEIASRALSPGINDPGTAIDVIRRLTRIFLIWGEIRGSTAVPDHDRVHLPALDPVDLMEDGFLGIERDGAGMVEVGVWLQTAYASLCLQPDAGIARAARDRASEARDRADRALDFPKDRERIAAAAAAIPRLPG